MRSRTKTLRAAVALATCAAGCLGATGARADEVYDLKKDVPIDAAVTVTTLGLVVGSELAKPDLVPNVCRWCSGNVLDDRARDVLRWSDPVSAANVSDITGFVVAPATAFGTLAAAAAEDGASRYTPVDALLVLEALAASAALNQIVKLSATRERPYGRFRTLLSPPTSDARLSFYSGHTSLTSTLAAASGTVAYLRGYQLAPVTWIPGAVIAAFTGYLRIAGDKHYFTDVVAGAIAGTAVGILLPVLFHPRKDGGGAAPAPTAPTTSVQVFSLGAAF